MNNVKMPFFRAYFESARRYSEQIRNATSEFLGERGTRYFLWSDGFESAGFAIRSDGELVYVFSTVKGKGAELVARAVELGATYLDCFDGYLPSLYARHGFVEIRREDNWTPGAPAVVYMRRVA